MGNWENMIYITAYTITQSVIALIKILLWLIEYKMNAFVSENIITQI